MKQKRFSSINKRMCLSFAVITSAITLVVSIALVLIFSSIMNNRIIENQKIFLKQNQTNIQNLINGINQISVYLASDSSVAGLLNRKADNPLELYHSSTRFKEELGRYLYAPLSDYLTTYFSAIYLYDNFEITETLGSEKLKRNADKLSNLFSIRAVIEDEWAKETIKRNGALYTFMLPGEEDTVYISRVVKNIYVNRDGGDISMGIMAIGISSSQFAKQVEALSLTENSNVYIINKSIPKAPLLYSSGKAMDEKITADILSSGNYQSGETIKLNGKKYFFMAYATYWDWEVISIIPYSDISKELQPTIQVAVLISAVGILIGIFMTALASFSITKPLKHLTAIMHTIDWPKDITVRPREVIKNHDEIELLYSGFDQLMERIEQLLDEVYQGGVRQKEAELLVLQAQINPHFIYNTLDSINWIALCNGNDDIAEIVSSLAEIVRYSINKPYEKATFKDELLHVDNYVKIQRKQNQHIIDIKYDNIEPYLDFKMPKFLIEPLVENAILHGFKGRDGNIIISCKEEKSTMTIQVIDDGSGADTVLLNQYLRGEIEILAQSDGFGIRNISERIHLNYSNEYGLEYFSNENGGMIARISLPYKKE